MSEISAGPARLASSASPEGRVQPQMAQHFNHQLAMRGEGRPASAREMDLLTDALMRDAIDHRVSDIHFEPMDDVIRVRFRRDGELLDVAVLGRAQGARMINHFKAMGEINPGPLFRPQEARLSYVLDERELDLRLAVVPCLNDDESMVLRLLMPEMLEQAIHALGLSETHLQRLHNWLESTSGMVLASGPTGAGKTTTLYAIMHELSQLNRAIFSIEDPPEYDIGGINQMRVDELHHVTYAAGLKAVLRMDPDFIMLGEIRDAVSAEAALAAANRGTVVLSTIHSRDPFAVVSTFRHWRLPDNEIAVSLNMLVAQRLVRRLCRECRYLDKPSDDQHRWLTAAGAKGAGRIWQARGCDHCRGLGYEGRTGIFEIWQLDEEDYEAILNGTDEHALRRLVHEKGYGTMLDDGLAKADEGITSVDALRRVPDLLSLRALAEHSRKRTSAGGRNTSRRGSTKKKKSAKSRNDGESEAQADEGQAPAVPTEATGDRSAID